MSRGLRDATRGKSAPIMSDPQSETDRHPPADDAVTHPQTPEQTPDEDRPEKDPEDRSPGEANPGDDGDSMEGQAPSG